MEIINSSNLNTSLEVLDNLIDENINLYKNKITFQNEEDIKSFCNNIFSLLYSLKVNQWRLLNGIGDR